MLEVLAVKQKKDMNRIETAKEEVKLSLFADGTNIYLKDPVDSNLQLLIKLQDTKEIYKNQ